MSVCECVRVGRDGRGEREEAEQQGMGDHGEAQASVHAFPGAARVPEAGTGPRVRKPQLLVPGAIRLSPCRAVDPVAKSSDF